MSNVKVKNIQHVYLNNKKVTLFKWYVLKGNSWIFYSNDFINGWYKKESTIKKKHIAIDF